MSILVMTTMTGTLRAKAMPRCSLGVSVSHLRSFAYNITTVTASFEDHRGFEIRTCSCQSIHYSRLPSANSNSAHYSATQIL